MSNFTRDTGKARLPALPPVNAQDASLRNWISAVAERLEVREGSRGNPFERAVTLRDLEAATAGLVQITDSGKPDPNAANTIPLGNGLSASINIDRFVESIRNTRLFRDLMKRLDDPTRFDHLASEIRDVLLKSIADEAAKRGADIQRTETKIQDANRSLAMAVTEITAALGGNAAGIREVQAAYVNSSEATATKVTQLESSLGNYYQDGSSGRVQLEQEMLTQATYTNGLRGQYTLKIQAGGALAGFGLAASEVNGVPESAFIITADKFAIVSPSYSGGLTTSPDVNHVPFGVDSNGIYLNNNVYVRGQMRVDAGGKTLADGLRGSLDLAASGTAWSDNSARQAVWDALGKTGSATTNNHLVIGDAVTISGTGFVETRYWTGSAWSIPGAIINGNLLVNGSVAAGKIDTRGLTIKDAEGNVIFGSGTGLDWDKINGTNKPEDGATRNVFRGNWTSGFAYAVGDIVLDGGNGWSAKIAHDAATDNKPPASGTGNTWWAAYTVKGDAGSSGIDGLSVVVPNASHTIPATSGGAVSSYTGSGTTIQVYEGTTALDAVASLTTTNSQFTIGTPSVSGESSITVGGRSYSSKTATVAQHNAMSSAGDLCVITYPITLRRANGTVVNLSVQQTITKSRAGATGQGQVKAVAFVRSATNPGAPSNTGTYASPTPSGWSDGIPAGTLPLWQTTRIFTSDGASPQQAAWTTPSMVANTSSVKYQFSTDNLNWSDTASTNSIYIRTGTSSDGGNTWTFSAGVLVKGEMGPAGPTVVVLVSRTPSFTATDGVLDAGQSSITFTAVVDGVASPSYLWTVTGTQSQPTLGNVASITLTAAQFGVATSAIVQCTVNGLSDQVAVHRLNKSTAAAGATVGAVIGQNVTLSDGSVLNSTDFVHRLSKINDTNIGTFMSAGAIGNAYIGNASISSAKIQDAAITSVKIENAAITSAKIGDAEIGTLKLAGNSVTIPKGVQLTSDFAIGLTEQQVMSVSMDVQGGAAWINTNIYSRGPEGHKVIVRLYIGGVLTRTDTFGDGFWDSGLSPNGNAAYSLFIATPPSGTFEIKITAQCNYYAGSTIKSNSNIFVLGAKR